MSGSSTGRRRRLVMAIAALILAADASAVVVHVVHGTSARSAQAASPSGDARASAAVLPHSEPVHWASAHSHESGTTNTTATSTNWSGYIDSGPTFTEVTADWVVPTVQVSQASQYSSTWIGIDGDIDTSSLIQTGTAQDTSAGTLPTTSPGTSFSQERRCKSARSRLAIRCKPRSSRTHRDCGRSPSMT